MAINDIQRDEFGSPLVAYGDTGETFYGNTTMDDTQIQEESYKPDYNPDHYVGYHNHGPVDNEFHHEGSRFLVNKQGHNVLHAQPRPVFASGIVFPATCRIVGINFKETTGAGTASLALLRGTDSSQAPLMYVTLAANESIRDFFPLPIEAFGGLYLNIFSGSVNGIIYTEESRNV